MRRILPQDEFVQWFRDFLPRVDLEPTHVIDVAGVPFVEVSRSNYSVLSLALWKVVSE
jgi:hypothetical protein